MNHNHPFFSTVFFVAVPSLLLALFIGYLIGNSDVLCLLAVAIVLVLVFSITVLSQYIWQIALIVCFTGFFYRPLGFSIGPTELTCGLATLSIISYGWQKERWEKIGVLKQQSFSLLRLSLFAWI